MERKRMEDIINWSTGKKKKPAEPKYIHPHDITEKVKPKLMNPVDKPENRHKKGNPIDIPSKRHKKGYS